MQIITVASQKGGTGKTTVAFNLAVTAAAAGLTAALIDLDPQGSAAKRHARRKAEMPLLAVINPAGLVKHIDMARGGGVDFLIIDTPPHNGDAAIAAARQSDLIVMPCQPSIDDLDAMAPTTQLTRVTGTPGLVVFNRCPPTRLTGRAPVVAEAAAALAGEPVEIYDGQITNRAAFSYASIAGQGITEFEPASKGADEIRALYAHIVNKLAAAETARPAVNAR